MPTTTAWWAADAAVAPQFFDLTVGLDFRLDLLLRHRLLRVSGESIARLLEALQAVGRQFATQQILDRRGRKKSGSFCLFRKRVGKRDLDGGHDCHRGLPEKPSSPPPPATATWPAVHPQRHPRLKGAVVPLRGSLRRGYASAHFATLTGILGLSGFTSTLCSWGRSTRSMSSIGIAPSSTSLPSTIAPVKQRRLRKRTSTGPT